MDGSASARRRTSAESACSREVITMRSVTDPEGGAGMDPDEEAAVAIGRAAERTLLVFGKLLIDAKDAPTRVGEPRENAGERAAEPNAGAADTT